MLRDFIKNLSILKKFLLINFIIFTIIMGFTFVYLNTIQPNLINKKVQNHIKIINNTTDHFQRLNINFNEKDIRKFLFSTRFLFQNIERVLIFDDNLNLIGDTDTLDLDPRSFSQRLEIIETESIEAKKEVEKKKENIKNEKKISINDILLNYTKSSELGNPYTFAQDNYDQFLLTTIQNVVYVEKNIGYIAITENANDIRTAINERKIFIIRTAFIVVLVILIFSFVLNRYFLKPIKNLVSYTKIIKSESKEKTNIENLKNRNDELGILSNSLD